MVTMGTRFVHISEARRVMWSVSTQDVTTDMCLGLDAALSLPPARIGHVTLLRKPRVPHLKNGNENPT